MQKLLLIIIVAALPLYSLASKCYGRVNCTACKTCSSCKPCNQGGGTCGVCGGGETESIRATTGNTNSSTKNEGISGKALLIGAGAVGGVYYLGKAGRKK